MAEFTGERVVPGEVDADLLNEHVARYAFAERLSRGKRVLDLGCGTGYGTARLASNALQAVGLDVAREALQYAAQRYQAANLRFFQASCTCLPLPERTVDLAVAFEVIEHLDEWPLFLEEVRRVLNPGGQLIVSTPNKKYYEETRSQTGPNPYHVHEFEFEEFRDGLARVFPHVSLYFQNHVDGFVFTPVGPASGAHTLVERDAATPLESHFFVAVCALAPQTGSPAFVYLPTTANVLRERERHIDMLDQQLEEARRDHADLLEKHRQQTVELDLSNRWAGELNEELSKAGAVLQERTDWAERLDEELRQKGEELLRCVDLLTKAENTLEERTQWALQLEAKLNIVRDSPLYRVARALRVVPRVPKD